jgi:asparagine synthetase B (glutamine-hydrolysing)
VTGLDAAMVEGLRERARSLGEINRISQFEIEIYLRNMLLRDADVFSMAAPIEYRVPLLDHRLVEIAFALPGEWKLPDPRPKPLLLDIAENRVPASVWKHRKQGFTFPWAEWLQPGRAMAQTAREAVGDTATWKSLGFDARAVHGIWNRFASGDRRISALQILAFITLRYFCVRHRLSA